VAFLRWTLRIPNAIVVLARAELEAYRRLLLGHRRLAIIDPEGAQQPMWDAASGLALTFNGEIYNFRELRSDVRRETHQGINRVRPLRSKTTSR
jgi:asparagine synthetase B (glutamine-hydrolysing)